MGYDPRKLGFIVMYECGFCHVKVSETFGDNGSRFCEKTTHAARRGL